MIPHSANLELEVDLDDKLSIAAYTPMNSHSLLAAKPDILVIDDTRENLRLLATMLSDAGYKVRKAINATLALKAVEVAKPDLIVLDIKLPDLDGYEVCRQLKAQAQTADIPIIFISALDEVLDKVKAFEVGGVDYITKPFDIQEVLVRIKNQLTIAQQQKQLIEQQQQLVEQNIQLQLLLTATVAISKSDDFQSALDVTLAQICEQIGWDYGEFWLPNSQATVFELGEGWYTRDQRLEVFRQETKQRTFATNRDLLRQICKSKLPCWFSNVSAEPCDIFQRNRLAREVELKTCLGVPILFGDQVLAVLLLFRKKTSEPDLRLIELVGALATQLGSLLQHKRSESALRESQQQLAAMTANIPGCVYRGVVHADGRIELLYISEGEYELSGLNVQEAMTEPERLLKRMSPNSQANFYKTLKSVAKFHKSITQEYPITSVDGKVKWVQNSARYSLMENGDIIVDGVAIDISDRIAAQEHLQGLEQASSASRNGH